MDRHPSLAVPGSGHPDILCYKLATGKFLDTPFSTEIIDRARNAWFDKLVGDSDLSSEKVAERTEHQTFYLYALGETLRLIGDTDHDIFWGEKDSSVTGVPVGYKEVYPTGSRNV